MKDILLEFLDCMDKNGLSPYSPSDIKTDNKRHNYRLFDDPPNKARGYYKLEIEGDFGYGFFGDYRDSEPKSWHSEPKRNTKYSKEDIEEFKRRNELARQEAVKRQEKLHQLKAKEAQDFILFLDDCPEDHPYLIKKGVKPHGLLLDGNDIIIPMGDKEQVWSYQRITPEGVKTYLKDGRKQHSYFVIQGNNEKILLCEGYSTGASAFEATGYTTIICFDSGNLYSVSVNKGGSENNIIICADNDWQGKDKEGNPRNTGLLYAEKIAQEIDCHVAYPELSENGMSDFNDYHALHGLEAVSKIIHEAPKGVSVCAGGGDHLTIPDVVHPAPDVAENDISWQERLITNKKGDALVTSSPTNLNLIMEFDPDIDGVFKYDSFAKVIIINRCPPWVNDKDFRVRPIQDYDYFELECYLEQNWELKTGKNRCADSILKTANMPKNTFNPASEYFSALEWDGVPRLGSWLEDYVSDGKQNSEYLTIVGRKFICGLAARAMNAGCKFDTMIIFEGKQYGGKSFLSKLLATINGEEYFLDDFKDIENKDALMKMQGKLVVEFPEISTLRKTEVNDLKAFITRQTDEFRPPYGRNVLVSPRQCVFVGTVNPEGAYLKDITGNRRYWPVSCRDKLPIDKLRDVIPLLHAEAAHCVKEGEQLWLNDRQYEVATIEQDARVVEDVWIDIIEEAIGMKNKVSTDEILQALNITVDKRTPLNYGRVKNTMLRLGFEEGRIGSGAGRRRGYIRIKKNLINQDDLLEEVIF